MKNASPRSPCEIMCSPSSYTLSDRPIASLSRRTRVARTTREKRRTQILHIAVKAHEAYGKHSYRCSCTSEKLWKRGMLRKKVKPPCMEPKILLVHFFSSRLSSSWTRLRSAMISSERSSSCALGRPAFVS
eukprot:scaffold1245_cov252-Pinguiococcus_pyrenoidosus.AAC.22